ncbi:dnaJ homolog subfamily C member 16-like [Anopheles aquasalis]|uniref:dnaJ homolog subfamily C member 16-like n=1 Tax=Anopheles aquasalis TaxID=42839 RepID=UPI00215B686D|nr:dnaJ homolog subfamily C member 16-like [Anopheles aquasalis]
MAEQRFVEIKQAYELLSDSERRKAYAVHNERGCNREQGAVRLHHTDISLYHRLSITAKYYESNILPKSRQTPQILLFYADWCFDCMKAANSFTKMIDTIVNDQCGSRGAAGTPDRCPLTTVHCHGPRRPQLYPPRERL